MRRIYLIELRRSPLRWALPLLIMMTLGMLFFRDTQWIGVWPQASAAAQNPAWFIAPVVAAATAWSAGRDLRAATIEQWSIQHRPPWQRQAAHLAASVTYGLGAVVVGAAFAAAVTVRDAPFGFLWPSYLLLATTLVVLSTAVGHAAGSVIGSWVAPLLATSMVTGLLLATPGSLHVLSGPPHLEVVPAALAARIALAASVVVGAVVVAARHWSRLSGRGRRSYVGPAAAAVLVGVMAVGVGHAGPLRIERTPPTSPLCTDAAPTVCVWPEHGRYIDDLAAAAQRLALLPGEVPVVVPEEFHERGLRRPVDEDTDGFVLHLAGEWLAIRGMVAAVQNTTFPEPFCPAATRQAEDERMIAQLELREWLVAWAYGGPKPDGFFGGQPAAEEAAFRVLTRPTQEQFDWARQRYQDIDRIPCQH